MSTRRLTRAATTERRLLSTLEMREVETNTSKTLMRGLAVPYREWASIGWFMEQFDVGSLGKSIKEAARALPLNLFHENRQFPIGSASEWDEQDGGLYGVWAIDDDPTAQRAAELAEKGHLTGLSIEFSPIRSEWDLLDMEAWSPESGPEGMDKVTRIEARLGAVGLVQTPAYVSAGVELVRSLDARKPDGPPARTAPGLAEWKRELAQLREIK